MKLIIYVVIMMSLSASLSGEVIDRIVAKVGDDIILESEFEEHRQQLQQLGALPPGISEADILNDMVESKLVLQRAKEKGYQVDEFRIRQLVNSQIEEQISHFDSESVLREELRRAGMSLSDLREFYQQMIREQRLKEMIIDQEIRARVTVSERELKEFYYDNLDQIGLRPEKDEIGLIMIVPQTGEESRKEIYREISSIYDRIREGRDFAELAKEYSDCPSSRLGGDLGFFGRGMMIQEFEDAAFELKPGEISDIVETSHGFHIIKMEEQEEDEIRVRHILKRIEHTDSDIQRAAELAEEIRDEIKKGADFKSMAKKYSDHPTSDQGGVLGEFAQDEYPEQFEEYLQEINEGEITPLIKANGNIYLLTILNTIPERAYTLEEVRDDLREYLLTEKQVDQYTEWIEQLMEDSYVEINL